MTLSSPLVLFAPKERIIRIAQADEIERIREFIEIVGLGIRTSKDVAKRMRFDLRQSSYYRGAAEILGFLNPRKPYTLTDLGRQFLLSGNDVRVRLMVCALLRNSIINDIISSLQAGLVQSVSRQDIEELIEHLSKLDKQTVRRRAQTALAWLRWLRKYYGTIEVSGDVVRLSAQQKMSEYV